MGNRFWCHHLNEPLDIVLPETCFTFFACFHSMQLPYNNIRSQCLLFLEGRLFWISIALCAFLNANWGCRRRVYVYWEPEKRDWQIWICNSASQGTSDGQVHGGLITWKKQFNCGWHVFPTKAKVKQLNKIWHWPMQQFQLQDYSRKFGNG